MRERGWGGSESSPWSTDGGAGPSEVKQTAMDYSRSAPAERALRSSTVSDGEVRGTPARVRVPLGERLVLDQGAASESPPRSRDSATTPVLRLDELAPPGRRSVACRRDLGRAGRNGPGRTGSPRGAPAGLMPSADHLTPISFKCSMPLRAGAVSRTDSGGTPAKATLILARTSCSSVEAGRPLCGERDSQCTPRGMIETLRTGSAPS